MTFFGHQVANHLRKGWVWKVNSIQLSLNFAITKNVRKVKIRTKGAVLALTSQALQKAS